MVREISVRGVQYRGVLPNNSPGNPHRITALLPSAGTSTSDGPVGHSWQTWQVFPTRDAAEAALALLEADAAVELAETPAPTPAVPAPADPPPGPAETPQVLPPESNVSRCETSALPARRGPGREPNILRLVGDKPLSDRARVIREYHHGALTAYAQSAMYALLCGFELHAARAQIGHAHWIAWVETNCPFGRTTAWRYMQAAERKLKQIPALAGVKDFALGVAPHEMAIERQEQLITAIRDATAGQTWRQLGLDLGFFKDAERKPDHPADGAGEDRSASRSREERFREAWMERLHELQEQVFKRKTHLYLRKAQLREVYEALGDIRNALKSAL